MLAAAGVVAVVAAVVVGTELTRETPQDAGRGTEAGTWSTFAADVVGVRRTDERSLSLVVELPAGGATCGRDARVEHLQDDLPDRPDTVYANVVYSAVPPEFGECPERRTTEVPMRVSAPLGDRMLLFNSSGPGWAPDGDHYRLCDDLLGCSPPEDHCDPVWIDQAVYHLDVPVKRLRSVREMRGCDGTWLVLDVNPAVGNCPPGGGDCDPGGTVSRWFLRFSGEGWETVLRTAEAGCAGLGRRFADFPTALCEDLPAP
ncbi:hypothetical protein SaccyDRAFT_1732 [Saccharomonospora cyanea NA-134]|uniref:Uncharacterized protein n=1 Tax=Saccharomonospora cyanea NA-134 TaxID=882082 RepID=H5XHE5_9PSEU|nr:hypothetical protein SaccyDRAFT_1732 [Saccharomonospora cyanea NA-134]